jgi:hypothetical protein
VDFVRDSGIREIFYTKVGLLFLRSEPTAASTLQLEAGVPVAPLITSGAGAGQWQSRNGENLRCDTARSSRIPLASSVEVSGSGMGFVPLPLPLPLPFPFPFPLSPPPVQVPAPPSLNAYSSKFGLIPK